MAHHPTVTCIVGVGPGLGAALTRRFADAGHTIALISRSTRHREPIAREIVEHGGTALGYNCDAGNPTSVRAAFTRIRDTLGAPQVLIYNAGLYAGGGLLELDPEHFEAAWRTNCYGAFLTAREVLPAMCAAGAGHILLTGATAARRGGAGFSGLAVGKFGLRALAQSMAREFAPQGIHVAHVVIDGRIAPSDTREQPPERTTETFLDPNAIAETYWQLYCQQPSAWTLELDLRPHVERF